MACPYFMPGERIGSDLWPHRGRLPLGDGFHGVCTSPGHEGAVLSGEELRDFCNLGYAVRCARMPQEREADAVRFIVNHDRDGAISLYYTCEREHAPLHHGPLTYVEAERRWLAPHPDARIQRMAECYLQSYLTRKCGNPAVATT